MKLFKKCIKFLSNLEDTTVLIIFLVVFILGIYCLYDSYLVYSGSNDRSLLKYKPERGVALEDKDIVGNIVGWVTIDDTSIDYPIMQGKTNKDYLNTNPYGEYSLSGSIFLDYRNNSDFSDNYSLVYGHHMEHGFMFGVFDEFLKEDFYKKHKTGELILKDGTGFDLHIFAVVESVATNSMLFAPGQYSKEEIEGYITSNSLYLDSDLYNTYKDKPIVALSTCKYPDTADRILLFCYKD